MKCPICGAKLDGRKCPECGMVYKPETDKQSLQNSKLIKINNPKEKRQNQKYVLKFFLFFLILGVLAIVASSSSVLVDSTQNLIQSYVNHLVEQEDEAYIKEHPDTMQITIHPKEMKPEYLFDEQAIRQMYSRPGSFAGKRIVLGGQLYSPHYADDYYANHYGEKEMWYEFKLDHGIDVGYGYAKVFIKAPYMTHSEIDDFFGHQFGIIEGVVQGAYIDEFDSRQVERPYIIADKYVKADYGSALSPTNYVTEEIPNAVIENSNYKVQITKIAYSEKNTQIYVTIQSKCDSEIHVGTTNEILEQSLKESQVISDTVINSMLPPSSILFLGDKVEGVFLFPPTDPNKRLKLTFTAYGHDNYKDTGLGNMTTTILFKPEK